MIKKTVQHLFEEPAQAGDFLMDASQVSNWDELCKRAKHREAWRTRVRELKMHKRITHIEMRSSTPTPRISKKKKLHNVNYPNTRIKMRTIASIKATQPPTQPPSHPFSHPATHFPTHPATHSTVTKASMCSEMSMRFFSDQKQKMLK